MTSALRLNRILHGSKANGPGLRFTIWVQGCSIHCDGCSNMDTWDPTDGFEMPPENLAKRINQTFMNRSDVSIVYSGITITGGEPLDQFEAVYRLCTNLSGYELFKDKTVFLTTGYTLEQIKEKNMLKILDVVDILCTGPFEKNKVCSGEWRGSLNQQIHFLSSKGYEQLQMPVIFKEVYIEKNGNSLITGFSQ